MNPISAGLLLFWGVYFSMAGSGNVVDLLTQHGYRGRYFRFSSKNYELLETMARKHGTTKTLITALFVMIMSWEILSAVTYLLALAFYILGNSFLVQYAFFVGIGLFAGLTLGNEVFIYYDDEEEHVVMFMAQLVSYMAFVLV